MRYLLPIFFIFYIYLIDACYLPAQKLEKCFIDNYMKALIDDYNSTTVCDTSMSQAFDNYYNKDISGVLFRLLSKSDVNTTSNLNEELIKLNDDIKKDIQKIPILFYYISAVYFKKKSELEKNNIEKKNEYIYFASILVGVASNYVNTPKRFSDDEKKFLRKIFREVKRDNPKEKKAKECLTSFLNTDVEEIVKKIDKMDDELSEILKNIENSTKQDMKKVETQIQTLTKKEEHIKNQTSKLETVIKKKEEVNAYFNDKGILYTTRKTEATTTTTTTDIYEVKNFRAGLQCEDQLSNFAKVEQKKTIDYFTSYDKAVKNTYEFIKDMEIDEEYKPRLDTEKMKILNKINDKVYVDTLNQNINLKPQIIVEITGRADNYGGSYNNILVNIKHIQNNTIDTISENLSGTENEVLWGKFEMNKGEYDESKYKPQKPFQTNNQNNNCTNGRELCFIIGKSITNLQLAFLRTLCFRDNYDTELRNAVIKYNHRAYEYKTSYLGDPDKRAFSVTIDYQTAGNIDFLKTQLISLSNIFHSIGVDLATKKDEYGKILFEINGKQENVKKIINDTPYPDKNKK